MPAAVEAAEHFLAFGKWLEENRSKMKGKYYIGKEAVDWYTRHVLLQPYDSDQLKLMAEMERARAISYLQFEMQKNRHLAKISPAKTIEEYINWDDETALITRRWYTEHGHDILSDRDYYTRCSRRERGVFASFRLHLLFLRGETHRAGHSRTR